MRPKSILTCMFLLSAVGSINPVAAQVTSAADDVKIASIETKLFAHPYKKDSMPSRVSRLERVVYGSEQSSGFDVRLNQLVAQFSAKPELTFTKTQQTESIPARTSNIVAKSNSDYPRVTELERELLDEHTFEFEPVVARLTRLEGKVFGRSWNQSDLAARTDRLAKYAYVTPKIIELQRAEALRVGMLVTAPCHPVQQGHQTTVVDEIESLEKLAFGKIFACKPISQRVDALELSMNGSTDASNHQDISSRVALLKSKTISSLPNRSGV